MTTFVLSIWGTPTTVEEPKSAAESPAPESPAATGSFARSKGTSRSATGGASRALKRVCLREESPCSNLDVSTGIEGVTVHQFAWFLLAEEPATGDQPAIERQNLWLQKKSLCSSMGNPRAVYAPSEKIIVICMLGPPRRVRRCGRLGG